MDSDRHDIACFEPGALDHLTTRLLESNFVLLDKPGQWWEGPIPEPVSRRLGHPTMELQIRDGFPFVHPRVFIPGLRGRHVAASHEVCLWTGEAEGDWLSLEDVLVRLDEWSVAREAGFGPAEAALDAQLYFEHQDRRLICLDPTDLLPAAPWDGLLLTAHLVGVPEQRLTFKRGAGGGAAPRALVCYRAAVDSIPRNLQEFREALTDAQRSEFDRGSRPRSSKSRVRYVLLLWPEHHGYNALTLHLNYAAGSIVAGAVETAQTDTATLQGRSGPDRQKLTERSVLCVGSGALGSQVAMLLARAGCRLRILDAGILRPGNVVRHAAPHLLVGKTKSEATAAAIQMFVPWAQVELGPNLPLSPPEIARAAAAHDLVLDCTGAQNVTLALSLSLFGTNSALISAALYREGRIVRVRRQGTGDMPIFSRGDSPEAFPRIPRDPAEPRWFEAGCASPVNNASPVSVALAAALTAEVSVDALTGRLRYAAETIQTVEPLNEEPFGSPGLSFFGAT